MSIKIERAYDLYKREKPAGSYTVLVDRIWPRGIRKEQLPLDEWAKQLAPSTELRKWFSHDTQKWPEFLRRYQVELQSQKDELHRLKELSRHRQLILIYGARDHEHNQAVALKKLLQP